MVAIEISIFLARFWGSLFIILGLSSIVAGLLGRIINYTKNSAITISTGYITFLLGLGTVVLHNLWVMDWRVAITILGWVTLIKGYMKIAFPNHIRKKAQMFKKLQWVWGAIIALIGALLFWASF